MKNVLRKSLLAATMMLAFANVHTNAQEKFLKEITSDDNTEYYYYHYNDINRLDSMYRAYGDAAYYQLYKYDANGNEIEEIYYTNSLGEVYPEYQDKFMLSSRNLYEYDAQNRLVKSITYEIDVYDGTGEFSVTSCNGFEYDEKGNLIKEITYYDESQESISEIWTYTYDENNNILAKDVVVPFFGDEKPYIHTEYEYDEEKYLKKVITYYLNDDGSDYVEQETIEYLYDSYYDLAKITYRSVDFDEPYMKYIIEHDLTSLSVDMVYPKVHAFENPDFYDKSVHAVRGCDIYNMDWDTCESTYYDHQNWEYEGVATGVENVISKNSEKMNIKLDGDVLKLEGALKSEIVRIYDMNGRPVFRGLCKREMNISNLASGVYMVKAGNVTKKIRK